MAGKSRIIDLLDKAYLKGFVKGYLEPAALEEAAFGVEGIFANLLK